MPEYLIYFNQQWVGDHTEEWFRGARTARHGGGRRDEGGRRLRLRRWAGGARTARVYHADPTSGDMLITDGPYVETKEFLGGFALVDVPDDETAKMWAGKVAEACGWPHEVRRFKPQRPAQ